MDILGFERVIFLSADRQEKVLRPALWAGTGADQLAGNLTLPLTRDTGAVAICLLEHRAIHVPLANSEAYGGLAGEQVLEAARCTGFAVAPVNTPAGVAGVLYADGGFQGADVEAEQAQEMNGLAQQMGLVLATACLST